MTTATLTAAHSIDAPAYMVAPAQQDDDSIIARALAILAARIKAGPLMGSPREVREYLTIQAAKHDGRELPNANRFADCLLRLPMFYDLTVDQVQEVCSQIIALKKSCRLQRVGTAW